MKKEFKLPEGTTTIRFYPIHDRVTLVTHTIPYEAIKAEETMRRFDAPPPRGPAPNKREREFLASRYNTGDMKGEIYVVWADYQEEISIDEPGLILPLKKPATTDASFFNWGSELVGGMIPQGISTLSYSILYYLLNNDLAVKYYVKFARAVVTHLPHTGWAIREVRMLQLIKESMALQESQIKSFGELLEKEHQAREMMGKAAMEKEG